MTVSRDHVTEGALGLNTFVASAYLVAVHTQLAELVAVVAVPSGFWGGLLLRRCCSCCCDGCCLGFLHHGSHFRTVTQKH